MLYTICKHIRNFFRCVTMREDSFKIENGTISLSFVSNGQYILIEGSASNDGLYQYPPSDLTDEEFNGTISVRAIPKDFLDLVAEIEAFTASYKVDGYTSESFGGYSYTKASNGSGGLADWQDVFKERLKVWRKL